MNSDAEYDSDATQFSGQDDDQPDDSHEIDGKRLEKWIPPLFYLAKSLFDSALNNGNCLSDFCLACWEKASYAHPIFNGSLCSACKQRILCTMFSKNSEGLFAYCTICGSKSKASVNCSNHKCLRKYCMNCVNIWNDKVMEKLMDNCTEWICFVCQPKHDIFLQSYNNLTHHILHFHEPLDVYAPRALNWKTKPLRVLSLFDGIGTGLVALRKLGIEVEVYYASEVLAAAATVSRTRLGGVLRHIGSVGEVTQQRLEEIAPIHLLIGGSPCNDFSAINRFPKDFYDPKGYSRYFFDFVRVLEQLRKINGPTQHLLWLFENVASMPRHYRDTISRHLDCQPAVIDAKNFSPQLRKRLFWGNIPGLFTIQDQYQVSGDENLTLDKSLMPNSGRRATQAKIRTLTTNTNSLLQGRTENCSNNKDFASLFPVRFSFQSDENESTQRTKGKNDARKKDRNEAQSGSYTVDEEDLNQTDVLWLQEIEHVFGLPRHFTDVGNMSRSDRQKLLGHAWSVPVIVSIFSHLKCYTLVEKIPSSFF